MAIDYTTFTDGLTEPRDHAPKNASLTLEDVPYERAKLLVEALAVFAHEAEMDELKAMHDGDSRREVRARQKRQQIILTKEWLIVEMNEDALRSGYVPSKEDRRDSDIEDGLRGAA